MYADLHTHSRHSDGTMTPSELVKAAKAAGVSLLSITDHNLIEAWPEEREAAAKNGVAILEGVEIDAIYRGEDLHILAYGANGRDETFARTVRHARAKLDEMSAELVRRIERAGKPARIREYEAYPRDPALGGWKALYYLADSGVCESPRDAFSLYGEYGVTYRDAGFESAEAVIRAIHGAGGFATLAHPGDVEGEKGRISTEDMLKQISELFEAGLDGVECFYPKHSAEATSRYLSLCRSKNALVTSGSDCHGDFSGKPVGYMRTTLERLSLGGLADKIIFPPEFPEAHA